MGGGGGERVSDIKTRELVKGGERAANVPPPTLPLSHTHTIHSNS